MEDKIEDTFEIVRTNIKKYRHQKQYTQEKLSELIDISHDYLRQIETGIRNPSLRTIIKIAGTLDVEVYQLFQ